MHLNKRNSGVADLSRAGKRTREEERPGGSTRESAEKRRQLYKTVVLFRVRQEKILKIQKKNEVFHMSGRQLLRAGGSSRCPRALNEDGA